MDIECLECNGTTLAIVSKNEKIIADVQSALDLAMTVKFEMGADKIAIDKNAITDDFFILSTGIAGEIFQKFTNYHIKTAIWGDYSQYTNKPLKDFIYESNKGKNFFFTKTKEEAIERLTKTA